jgi:hypothetical protein
LKLYNCIKYSIFSKNSTTISTKFLISNKLGYARNEIKTESIKSKISNINNNNKDDEKIVINK